MNYQKITHNQQKLFASLDKLCFKYRFFIISSNILKISSLGIILIIFFLFGTLLNPKLINFISTIIIFITTIATIILLVITVPKILKNKVINKIDQLLRGEHRFITAWELRNTKHYLANFQAQDAISFLKQFDISSKIPLLPKTLTTIFFVLSLTSILAFSLTNQSISNKETNTKNQINTTELSDLLNSIEKNRNTSLTSEETISKVLKNAINELEDTTSHREIIESISDAIESLEEIKQTSLNKNKFQELISQIKNEELNQILTNLQSTTLDTEDKKNLMREQAQKWPATTLESKINSVEKSLNPDVTTKLFETILSMLNKDNENISEDSIENIVKEIEKMTSQNIEENIHESFELFEKLRINLLQINNSQLQNEENLSTTKYNSSSSAAGNPPKANNKNTTQSWETIPETRGDSLLIQNETINNNSPKTNHESQETYAINKQTLNAENNQINKTYEEQARMYINKHSIPDKYHKIILEYFIRLSENSS